MPNVAKHRASLAEPVRDVLKTVGSNIRIARKRRRWSLASLAERLNTTVPTVQRIEAGDPGVGVGLFVSALWAMGLLGQVGGLAEPDSDEIGKTLELARLPRRVRASGSVNDF